MPWYRITVRMKNGQTHQGVRQNESSNIDALYTHYIKKAHDHYGESKVKQVEVVMLPKNSEEVRRVRR